MSASVACVVRLPVLSCVTEVRAETHRCRDEPAGRRLPPGLQPGPGEPFQRQRRTALPGLHQTTHPALDRQVETTLCPAAGDTCGGRLPCTAPRKPATALICPTRTTPPKTGASRSRQASVRGCTARMRCGSYTAR